MSKKVFNLVHPEARRRCADYAQNEAPEGWRAVFEAPKKRRIQEERYHAMLGDIAKQCDYHGRRLPLNSWKRLLVEAFVQILRDEARGQGKPDPFPDEGEVLPSLDGRRIVQVEVLTRDFTVAQASAFIEHLFAWGADRAVVWSDPVERQAA